MKRNKKLLVSFLALNAILSSYATGATAEMPAAAGRYDRLYNSVVKNIEKGNTNEKTYQVIERILKQKNKELKDLYLQGDYIVKPEYLEWQIFFTGFYDEYSEGRDNTKENAAYHSKVNGYYDANGNFVMTSGSINGMIGKPHQQLQQPKEIDLGVAIQVREPSRQPISLGVTKPSMPQISPNAPASISINPPVIPLMPNLSFEITPPATFNVPVVNANINLNLPNIAVRAFNPVTPTVTTITIDPVATLNLTFPGSGNGDAQWINKTGSVAPLAQQNLTGQSGKGTLDAVSHSTTGAQNFDLSLHNTGAIGMTTTSHTQTNNGIQNFDWTGVTSSHAVMKLVGSHPIAINNMDMRFIGVGNKASGYLMLFHTDAHNFNTEDSVWTLAANTDVKMSGQKIILYGVQSHASYTTGSGMINNGTVTADASTSASTSQGTNYTGLNPFQRIIFTTIDADSGNLTRYNRYFYFTNNGTITLNGTSDVLANFATPGSATGGTLFTNNSNVYLNGQSSVGIMLNSAVSNFGGSKILLNSPLEIAGDKSVGVQLTNSNFNLANSIINLNLGSTGNAANSTGNITLNDPNLVEGAVGLLVSSAGSSFTLKDYKINIGDHSLSNAGVRVATGGINLGTGGTNSSINFSSNSEKNAGISITGSTSSATTAGITINLDGYSNVGVQVESSGVFNHSNGTINVSGTGNSGITTLSSATTNMNNALAVVNVGAKSTGAYNNSIFNLTAGTITATGDSAVAVYGAASNINTNINGGNIEAGSGGIALFSGNSAAINIKAAANLKANAGGLLFYNHEGGTFTGKYVLDGIVNPRVEAGGMVFYYKGGSLTPGDLTGIPNILNSFQAKTLFGTDGLNLSMAAGSSLIYLETTSGLTKNISDLATLDPNPLSASWLTVTPDSGAIIKTYTLSDLNLILDHDIHSNLDTGIYSQLQILSSDITINNGITVAGTKDNQIAVVQRNKTGSTIPTDILITNNGTINLAGDDTVGLVGDYAQINTSSGSAINLYGDNAIGIISANGAQTTNAGTIVIDGDESLGIYGGNTLDDTPAALGYGDGKINITHSGEIKTTATAGKRYGIYVENLAPYGVSVADSVITTTAASKIDLSLAAMGGVGIYSDKTTVNHSGSIKINSTSTDNGTGIYAIKGSNAEILAGGSIAVTGDKGYGFFLENSTGRNSGTVTVGKESIAMSLLGASTGNNSGTLTVGEASAGLYIGGTSTGNNNSGALITSSDTSALGIYVLNGATGTNAGNITLTGQKSSGVYNKGIFTMSGGTVEVNSVSGAGIYADTGSTTNINSGTIKAGKGAIALYANGSTINVAGGTNFDISGDNDGKSIFAYNYNSLGAMTTGKVNLTGTSNAVVNINSGGIGFYVKGMTLNTYIDTLITNSGTGKLEIMMNNSNSNLYVLDSPGAVTQLSTISSLVPGTNLGTAGNVIISTGSISDYGLLTLVKGELEIDQNVNLDIASDAYNKSDFINSSVKLNSGNSISGGAVNALGIGQRNYNGGTLANLFIQNDGAVNLTGLKSTGIASDFGRVQNSAGASISVGDEGIGIYGANSSQVLNSGSINLQNNGVGIYGANYFDGVTSLGYGTDDIDITNSGNIISTGTTGRNIGIYANNAAMASSAIVLNTGSNIDVSSADEGIGVYAVNSSLAINDGNITVGKNGIGVYASGTTGTIAGGTVNLIGDNAVGYYLTNASTFTNTGGNIHVDGQNIVLTISDATSSLNFLTPFSITATPGSTYVAGSMTGGEFYNNTTATLGANGMLINGLGTAALFGTASVVNSTGTNVAGMVLTGQYTDNPFPHLISGTPVDVEGTNLGIISLGDSSAGMYLMGGARGTNKGTISVNNYSVGMYAENGGTYISNDNGIINIGQESTGLFLKNGAAVSNTGTAEINSTSQKAVGIYSENSLAGTAVVMNTNKIDLSGDQSIGIYTTGENGVVNNGIIQIGNSLSPTQPGVGIYADHVNSYIFNTGLVSAGDNSIGIYNQNGHVSNTGTITAGNSGTGIYSEGGTITLQTGSHITVGQNDAVGVYAVNQAGLVLNDSTVSVGDGSYGFVFTGTTTPSFINNQPATIGNNSIYVFADSTLNADNSGTLTMTGSDNIGYYLKNGGSFVNNADIIGSAGVSNIGVYAKGANIVNNADIILGDSNLIEHTDSNGEKYNTGYSVGIYGENSNITNNIGRTIQVGKDGIGMYVKGAGYTADNHGIISGVGENAKGIFASDYAIVNNYGVINMTGDNVIGIAGQSGAQIYNHSGSTINVTGNDVSGIYLSGDDTKLVNNGTINITGTGMGILYTSTVDQSNVTDSTGTTQGYTSKQYEQDRFPTLTNTGVININVGGNFNYDGIRVIVTIDPSTNTPTTNSSNQVGFGGVIPDKLEVAPDFATGTASDKYVFENIFRGATGKGEYISQSLTWTATAEGANLVMTRKAYTEFTDGLWYEDFGRVLNEKYAVTYGEGRKIFDKINYITYEGDFRHIMASLAGNVYANINQREYDIAKAFEESLHLLQDSTNNTKENIKMSVIAGKGKNKEETDGVVGYDYTTTGVLALREVERTYRHTFGYSLGYVHTGFEFKDGNESEEWVDTIQLGVHNKYKANGWKLVNDLTGRASIHNVDRNIDWPSPNSRSEMDGTYETYSITSDNILGKEFEIGKKASIMPYGAFKAMYVTRPKFNEKGLEALEVEGNDAWSAKPRAGVELKGAVPLGANTAWQLKGTLDLAYEYELADLNEREKARLISIEDGYHKLSKPEDEKGTFRTRAALGVEVEDRYGIFLTGEYSTGNDKEDDYRAGVTLKAVF
jgi:hypothetical protein